MTLREYGSVAPELLVIVASRDDAAALAALRTLDAEVHPTLVATGPDPMLVDEILDDLGAPAGRVLLPAVDDPNPAREVAALLPRLDDLVGEAEAAAVVVRGGTTTALATAQVAVWRGVPLIALPAPDDSPTATANRAMIAELVAWQSTAAGAATRPTRLDLLVHQRMAEAAAPGVVGMGAARPGGIQPWLSA